MPEFPHTFETLIGQLGREWIRRHYSLQQMYPTKNGFPSLRERPDGRDAAILLAGRADTDHTSIQAAFRNTGISFLTAHSPDMAAHYLGHRAVDVLIVPAAATACEYRPLLAALSAHTEMSRIPILVPHGPRDPVNRNELERLGAILAPETAPPDQLHQWISDAVMQRRLASALNEAFLAAAPGIAGQAPGTFSNAFARTHLETLLASDLATTTSLAQVEISPSAMNRGGGAGRRALAGQQLVSVVPNGVLVADAPGDSFWLLFPENDRTETEFRLGRAAQRLRAGPANLFPLFRILTAHPGENVVAFVRRCDNLRSHSVSGCLH